MGNRWKLGDRVDFGVVFRGVRNRPGEYERRDLETTWSGIVVGFQVLQGKPGEFGHQVARVDTGWGAHPLNVPLDALSPYSPDGETD
jgi:hypothetical protein